MSRPILALDLGTKTGWAYSRHGLICSNTKLFTPRKKDHPAYRWVAFKTWLSEMLASYDIQAVYYEQVRNHAGVRAGHCYGAFEALLEIACYSRNCELIPVGVGTIKKFATGKGNASKSEMISWARLHDKSIGDDNHADAFHLLRYALSLEAD